jgi:hypothetical protein
VGSYQKIRCSPNGHCFSTTIFCSILDFVTYIFCPKWHPC